MNAETSAASTAPPWLRGRFARWIFATDHKQVGVLWLAVGGVGIALAGILALLTALQTARADASILGEGTFASVATLQGTLVTSVGILPLALGLAVALLPLQIGASGLAHPGLAASALWLGVVGSVAVMLSPFAPGEAPRSMWTTFPTVALAPDRAGESVRLCGLLLIALAALLTAVALVATLREHRAPEMTNDRLPPFAQAVGIFGVALLVLAPVSLLGHLLLLLARENPGSFDWYITGDGALLQGYGWVFAQGLVAVCIVPALGAAVELVATLARAELHSRKLVMLGLVATAVLVALTPSADTVDLETWATVLALLAAAACCMVAALALTGGLRALARDRAGAFSSPLPFAVGALLLMLLGGVATLIFLVQHDDLRGTTFADAWLGLFLVATLLGLVGGVVYWWPKLSGRMLGQRLTTSAAIVLTGSGVLLALGRAGAGWANQPSRTGITIEDAEGWSLLGSLGVVGVVVGLALVGLAIARAADGRRVGNDPWLGDTLEWYTTSPPPAWNFDSLPPVTSARPLADLRQSLKDKGAL